MGESSNESGFVKVILAKTDLQRGFENRGFLRRSYRRSR